jgi:hypothetical protein
VKGTKAFKKTREEREQEGGNEGGGGIERERGRKSGSIGLLKRKKLVLNSFCDSFITQMNFVEAK